MSTAIVKSKGETFRRYVEGREAHTRAILPAHLTPRRMTQLILAAANENPRILDCKQSTIASAIKVLSELGLEPGGTLGLAYLIPYGRDLTVQIGYKGLCALALRSGMVRSITADVVYQSEVDQGLFSFTRGPVSVRHEGSLSVDRTDPDQLVAAWCRIELMTDGVLIDVLTKAEIHARRAKSAAWQNPTSPWQQYTAAMWRKTALRKLIGGGTVPQSSAMKHAFELEPAHVDSDVVHNAAIMAEHQDDVADSAALDHGYEDPA